MLALSLMVVDGSGSGFLTTGSFPATISTMQQFLTTLAVAACLVQGSVAHNIQRAPGCWDAAPAIHTGKALGTVEKHNGGKSHVETLRIFTVRTSKIILTDAHQSITIS